MLCFHSMQRKMVKSLICGERHVAPPEKRFLFDIVANHRNSIDVDKVVGVTGVVRGGWAGWCWGG